MKILEAQRTKEFASTYYKDPILQMAVNAVLDAAPEAEIQRWIPVEKRLPEKTERERLLAILNEPIFPHAQADPLEAVADYLLDSGVAVPRRCGDCGNYKTKGCSPGFGWCIAWDQGRTDNHYCSESIPREESL